MGEGDEEGYSLAASKAGLGELSPILKDAHGNIIDGFHRVGENADWHCITVETVDTPVKLALARLAVNYCRRKVGPEELKERITFLVKEGLKPEEIAKKTGISLTTIYKYMPQEKKDLAKVEAGKKGAEIKQELYERKPTPAEQTVKTQETDEPVECENCHMSTSQPQNIQGHNVCPQCALHYKTPATKQTPTEYKPKDTWEHRKAIMSPQHSRMEEVVLSKLHEKGVGPVEVDREFCLQSTTPDFYFPSRNLAVYLDGPMHQGREDRDEQLRERLTERYGLRVISIPYDSSSQQEVDRVLEQIIKGA